MGAHFCSGVGRSDGGNDGGWNLSRSWRSGATLRVLDANEKTTCNTRLGMYYPTKPAPCPRCHGGGGGEVGYKKKRNPAQVHRVTKLWMEPCQGVAEIDDRAQNVAEALTANRINQTDH